MSVEPGLLCDFAVLCRDLDDRPSDEAPACEERHEVLETSVSATVSACHMDNWADAEVSRPPLLEASAANFECRDDGCVIEVMVPPQQGSNFHRNYTTHTH